MPGQLIDQLLMAAVVVNAPPYKGALTACHPHHRIDQHAAPLLMQRAKDRLRLATGSRRSGGRKVTIGQFATGLPKITRSLAG
jgi:hypothetical protein